VGEPSGLLKEFKSTNRSKSRRDKQNDKVETASAINTFLTNTAAQKDSKGQVCHWQLHEIETSKEIRHSTRGPSATNLLDIPKVSIYAQTP